jgi:hypothetical protein
VSGSAAGASGSAGSERRCKFNVFALALLNSHLITLLNDPNLNVVHMQEAGCEIH